LIIVRCFFCSNRKFRLDDDHQTNKINEKSVSLVQHSSSLLVTLHNEIDSSLTNRFSIEYLPVSHTTKSIQLDDEYLSKNGLVLRCKLLEITNPIIPPLRLRISTRYPDDQPEILSLTKSMPPKLEYSGQFCDSFVSSCETLTIDLDLFRWSSTLRTTFDYICLSTIQTLSSTYNH